MSEIKRCPCGQVPSKLITTGHTRPKWAYVNGDCCGAWEVEFRNSYKELNSAASNRLALDAWNEAPRSSAETPPTP